MVAAPLMVGGKAMGALCFASKAKRRSFDTGAEELMGLLARLLGMRIELRQTGKMLSEASRAFARTLEHVDKPAVMLDLDYEVSFVNKPMLDLVDKRESNLMGRDFFNEVVRNDDISKRMFHDLARDADGKAFSATLELRTRSGKYQDHTFEVMPCKDDTGGVASYALIEQA